MAPRTTGEWAVRFMKEMKEQGYIRDEIRDTALNRQTLLFARKYHIRKAVLLDYLLRHQFIEPYADRTWCLRFDIAGV